MDIETVSILSGVLVIGLAVAAKLALARILAAKPVPVEQDQEREGE